MFRLLIHLFYKVATHSLVIKRFCIAFVFLWLHHLDICAQQLPLFTQYRENHGYINPATVNSDYFTHEYNLSAGATYRRQWGGQSFTPRTQAMHFEYLFTNNKLAGLLLGAHFLNDQTGPTGLTGFSGRLGVVMSEDPYWGGVVAALSLGAMQFRINPKELKTSDRILSECDCQKIIPDIGLGVYAYKRFSKGVFDQDVIYGGISVPQTFGFEPDLKLIDEKVIKAKRVAHFYGLLGMYKYFADYRYIEPSVWVKYVPNAPVNVDVNIRYAPIEHFWLGVGYSTSKSIHLEFGLLFGENLGFDNTFRIGYGFDKSVTSYGPYFGGSHEFNISFAFGQ